MKNLLLLLFFTLSFSAIAQHGVNTYNVESTLNDIKSKVTLTPDQEIKVTALLEAKKANIESVISLRSTDIEKYIAKREAIDSGMNFSIKRLLDKNQKTYFQEYLNNIRLNKANLRGKMKKDGKTPIEIKLAAAEL